MLVLNSNLDLLKVSQVALRLNVGRDKVLDMIKSGSLKSIRLGPKTIRVYACSVESLLETS